MELQTGKRLQPYYDRADRPRIDARQTLVNHHYGLHDPNAPENRRTLTLPDNLPETKQALAEGVTRGIDALYHAGEIKGRQDVIQALTEAGAGSGQGDAKQYQHCRSERREEYQAERSIL
ncbi:relaxase/mobilization nuclease domain-containing protein [Escherichia coli]|nr:relaxase/mobilization nuclease domain-containing protein [Escherichia coli]MBW6091014.1 relaxase/mobilization nuclease domain-containing protein [Escherichia coli]